MKFLVIFFGVGEFFIICFIGFEVMSIFFFL